MFPTPLYVTSYEGDTTEIVKYFDGCVMKEPVDGFGSISKDTYILENPVCEKISEFFMMHFKKFGEEVMRYEFEDIQFTQSWISYKYPDEFHNIHTHPNCIISGVFYYDNIPPKTSIFFRKNTITNNRAMLEPALLQDYQQHPYSQEEIHFIPKKNDFIIFPSFLSHGVSVNENNSVRKSLGINALTKGKIGDRDLVTEIIFSRHK